MHTVELVSDRRISNPNAPRRWEIIDSEVLGGKLTRASSLPGVRFNVERHDYMRCVFSSNVDLETGQVTAKKISVQYIVDVTPCGSMPASLLDIIRGLAKQIR